jgi:hypothetical protein
MCFVTQPMLIFKALRKLFFLCLKNNNVYPYFLFKSLLHLILFWLDKQLHEIYKKKFFIFYG